jgi:hypothetical protein
LRRNGLFQHESAYRHAHALSELEGAGGLVAVDALNPASYLMFMHDAPASDRVIQG